MKGAASERAPARRRLCTRRPRERAPAPTPQPAARPEGRGRPRRPRPPLPPRAGGRRPLAGRAQSPAPGSRGPMSARLSARQPRRLGGWEPERWPRSQQRGALAERPVGGVPAPRTPARPAGPARLAATMGAAAVRWHLCVLLALGARGRLAGGSGLPGKPRAAGRRARAAAGSPVGPRPAPSRGLQPARPRSPPRLFAK